MSVSFVLSAVLSAVCQIGTAAGLQVLRPLARAALAFAACCGLAAALLPATPAATATAHVRAVTTGAMLLALWPVLAISHMAPPTCRARWAIAASSVLCALLVWVFYEAQDGLILGLAERVTVVAELMWPLVVVVTARRPMPLDRRAGPECRGAGSQISAAIDTVPRTPSPA